MKSAGKKNNIPKKFKQHEIDLEDEEYWEELQIKSGKTNVEPIGHRGKNKGWE